MQAGCLFLVTEHFTLAVTVCLGDYLTSEVVGGFSVQMYSLVRHFPSSVYMYSLKTYLSLTKYRVQRQLPLQILGMSRKEKSQM